MERIGEGAEFEEEEEDERRANAEGSEESASERASALRYCNRGRGEFEDDEEEEEVSVADEKDATPAYSLHSVESESSGQRVLFERNAEDLASMRRAVQTESSFGERMDARECKENMADLLSLSQHMYLAQKQQR